MLTKIKIKVICALLILMLISGVGFLSLPPLQQTGENLLVVIIAVLSGPIVGTISILANNTIADSYKVLIVGFSICATGAFWYLQRRTLLSFAIAAVSWNLSGFLLCIGIYI